MVVTTTACLQIEFKAVTQRLHVQPCCNSSVKGSAADKAKVFQADGCVTNESKVLPFLGSKKGPLKCVDNKCVRQ